MKTQFLVKYLVLAKYKWFADRNSVAVGFTLNKRGGVKHHINALVKYSKLKLKLIPDDLLLRYTQQTGQFNYLRNYISEMQLNHFKLVHSHVDPMFINLCHLAKNNDVKWVHTYHLLYLEEDYPEGLLSWQIDINNALIEVADKADIKISVSKWWHDYLLNKYSIQTVIIPNGVDFDQCDKAKPNRFINNFSLRDFVLFVGSLQRRKNPQLFVKVAQQMPDIHFVMIGEGLHPSLIEQRYCIFTPDNLTILGEMDYESVLDAISACKVLVMTSKREGLPTVLLEAMAMGKNVVAPNQDGCKEAIHSNNYGFLYEPESLIDIVSKTRHAFESSIIGAKAQSRAFRKYDWRIIAPQIDAIYESLL